VILAGAGQMDDEGFLGEKSLLIGRLTANGAADATFGGGDGMVLVDPGGAVVASSEATSVVLQPDGRIVAAGYSLRDQGSRLLVVRHLSDGTPDPAFGGGDGLVIIASTPADADVFDPIVFLLPDAKLLLAATLERQIGESIEYSLLLARLNADGGLDTTFAAPHGWLSVNPVSEATHHFQLNDALMDPTGKLVVVGDEVDGNGDRIQGIVARYHVTEGIPVDPLAAWRQQHFGATVNEGPAANDADPNGNGIVNYLEFAMAGDPKAVPGLRLPAPTTTANGLQIVFTRSRSAASITTLGVEWSHSLAAGSWSGSGVAEQVTATTGDVQTLLVTIPLNQQNQRFLRWVTRAK
jgi:uncharacterized delta-60 repeat protein